jgi:hypothetical protein
VCRKPLGGVKIMPAGMTTDIGIGIGVAIGLREPLEQRRSRVVTFYFGEIQRAMGGSLGSDLVLCRIKWPTE